MNLVDLHCDTPYRIYDQKLAFDDDKLQVSSRKLFAFDSVTQIFAFWSDKRLSDQECYEAFWNMRRAFLEALDQAHLPPQFQYYLAVEDARLLCGNIDRLDILHGAGVRLLTLMWHGTTLIGGACDTPYALMPFGRQVVQRCFELGIVPDVSHASSRCIEEIGDMAVKYKRPIIASHSNAAAVTPHNRNLQDWHFELIKNVDGIVGISMAPRHLSTGDRCSIADVIAHIEHFCSLGGENHICLGCDFDGIDATPAGLENVEKLPRLASEMSRLGYRDELINKIFYENAQRFLFKYVK